MSDAETPDWRQAGGDATGGDSSDRDRSRRDLHDAFLGRLVADLHPVRPLGAPWPRIATWLALVLALAVVLGLFANMQAVAHRLMAVPDMWAAVLGSILTMILASVAAFQLSLPDRSPTWALLPLPGLALWIGASGMGCLRDWLLPGTTDATMVETRDCLAFIIGLSLPLSAVVVLMLRLGYSLYPSLMGTMAGLGVAAAAATLLNFFHPYDAAATDLAVHAVAVLIVVVANRLLGGIVFGARGTRP